MPHPVRAPTNYFHWRRRELLFLSFLGPAYALEAYAQSPRKARVIGILWHGSKEREDANPFLHWYHEDFAKLGYRPGDIVFEERFASERQDLYDEYAKELVALRPDVLATFSLPGALALQQATKSIPIVFGGVPDPVGGGLVTNLARPGGNMTGISNMSAAVYSKRIALFKEVVPSISRVALIVDKDVPVQASHEIEGYQAAAAEHRIEIRAFHARDAAGLESSFAEIVDQTCNAVIIGAQVLYFLFRSEIAALALVHRLPSMAITKVFASDGILLAYGADAYASILGSAMYVKRILEGEKPGELPVQQPTKLSLIINVRTATHLGLEIPASVLARADEVVE